MYTLRRIRRHRIAGIEVTPEHLVVEELIEDRSRQHLEHHEWIVDVRALLKSGRKLGIG